MPGRYLSDEKMGKLLKCLGTCYEVLASLPFLPHCLMHLYLSRIIGEIRVAYGIGKSRGPLTLVGHSAFSKVSLSLE